MDSNPAPASLASSEQRAASTVARGAIALVIVAILALQLIYFTGVIASDDLSYVAPALHVLRGQPFTADSIQAFDCHCFARFAYWKLVQLAIFACPGRSWAIALPSLAASVVTLLVVYVMTRRQLGRAAGVVSVVLCGLVPAGLCSASIAVPDMVAGTLAWIGVALAATALLAEDTPRAGWRCLAAGLLIGAGYNAKEVVALMMPGLMLFIIVRAARARWAWKRAAILGVGAGLWLAVEALVLWYWTGDPLFHSHAVVRSQRGYAGPPIDPSVAGVLSYWADYLRWLADPWSELGPVGPVLLVGLGFALVKRSPATNLLLCAVIPPLMYLSVGSTELGTYRPAVHQPRYLVPLLPGLAMLAGAMVRHAARIRPWGTRGVAVAGTVVIALSLVAPNRIAGRWYHAASFSAARRLLAEQLPGDGRGTRLCASQHTLNKLLALTQWLDSREIELIRPPPANAEQWAERYGGAYVITSRNDRRPPSHEKHAGLTLWGPALGSLAGFEHVSRVAPPRDRLSTLWARLRGRPGPTDPEWAVDLWRVPAPGEWPPSALRARRAGEAGSPAVPF